MARLFIKTTIICELFTNIFVTGIIPAQLTEGARLGNNAKFWKKDFNREPRPIREKEKTYSAASAFAGLRRDKSAVAKTASTSAEAATVDGMADGKERSAEKPEVAGECWAGE